MKFSSLLDSLPDYPFQKVARISREVEKRDGIKVINARIGIPDREAPEAVKEALAKYALEENSTMGYPCDTHPERGIPELIDAIIEKGLALMNLGRSDEAFALLDEIEKRKEQLE